MEEQVITVIIKTSGEKCEMSDSEITAWYEEHIRALFHPAFGTPEISVEVKRRDI